MQDPLLAERSPLQRRLTLSTLPSPHREVTCMNVIGEGAYGKVYKGYINQTRQIVGIKVIPVIADEKEEIALELEVLARFSSHKNIAHLFGAFLDPHPSGDDRRPQLYLVMQYCAYGSATELALAARRPRADPSDPLSARTPEYLPEDVIAYILRETLSGLAFIHSNSLIHRDIKGQNILFTRHRKVKLVDFGVCALLQENSGKRDTVIGTPYWMAPEVIACETAGPLAAAYDSKCDIWSFAITAIEIAEGAPPLSKLPPMKALYKIPTAKPPTLQQGHRWSRNFQDVLAIALKKDPKKRPHAYELKAHPFFLELDDAKCDASLRECLDRLHAPLDGDGHKEWDPEDQAVIQTNIDTLLYDDIRRAPLKSKEENYGAIVRQWDNLARVQEVTEKGIVDALLARYQSDVIYTFMGDILIACNPFKHLHIYNEKFQDIFVPSNSTYNPIPHVYAVAHAAFKQLMHTASNQCCVISGESGAGKTETSKYFLRHLLTVASRFSIVPTEDAHHVHLLQQKITDVNPILEAFGNAKTVMNSNSSRFGKYLEVRFTRNLNIQGARLAHYLLETSRVTNQGPGERAFHVFYFLLAGADESERLSLGLMEVRDFAYLGGVSPEVAGADEARRQTLDAAEAAKAASRAAALGKNGKKENMRKSLSAAALAEEDKVEVMEEFVAHKGFRAVMNCLTDVGFTPRVIDDINLVLAVVLHIGNIAIGVSDSEDNAEIFGEEALHQVAKLLGVRSPDLANALVSSITVTRGETIIRRLTVEKSEDCRNAMAKALYGGLFSWLVSQINQFLAPDMEDSTLEVGILDIFGFENFQNNSFEQLCINVANEQLQYYFNQHIFAWELKEMEAEGLSTGKITYTDNKPLIDLFLKKPIGILTLIDEESVFPKGTDQSLVEKLHQNFKKLPYYEIPKRADIFSFVVHHYAGPVEYSALGFLEKNRDTLSSMVSDLLATCSVELIHEIFNTDASGNDSSEAPSPALNNTNGAATFLRNGITPTALRNANANARKSSGLLKPETLAAAESARNNPGFLQRMRQSVRRATTKKSRRKNNDTAKMTVGQAFKSSLSQLMAKMMAATPHFIRCIKPNMQQKPDLFSVELVQKQLKYTGVLATVQIRRMGYPIRLDFNEFLRRYQVLAYPLTREIPEKDLASACRKILSSDGVVRGNETTCTRLGFDAGHSWEIGKTKVFLKYYFTDVLATLLQFYHKRATVCQALIRSFLARHRVRRLREELVRKAREEAERKAREEAERKAREEAERRAREEAERKAREEAERKAREEAERKAREEAEEAERLRKQAEEEEEGDGPAEEEDESKTAPERPMTDREKEHASMMAAFEEAARRAAEAEAKPRIKNKPMRVDPFNSEDYEKLDLNLVPKSKIPKGCEGLNRYLNILPNPLTRVVLPQMGDDETTTFINANYIHGWDGVPGAYIATQGPMSKTMAAFWRMVWENDSRAIIMVTGLKEKGVEKCARYWPNVLYNEEAKVGDVKFADLSVAVVGGFKANGYITTKIRMRKETKSGKKEEERIIMHYWFNSWPDHGVPQNKENVYHMLKTVREWSNDPMRPWVVHCSAGVGRTGTFIAIDHGITLLDVVGRANVSEIIGSLREDRCAMVQHLEQAEFVHAVLENYADTYGLKVDSAKDVLDGDEDEILAESVQKAMVSVPTSFTIHPSQENTEEADEDVVPSWRIEQLDAKVKEEEEEVDDLLGQSGGRKRAERIKNRRARLDAKRQSVLNRIQRIESGKDLFEPQELAAIDKRIGTLPKNVPPPPGMKEHRRGALREDEQEASVDALHDVEDALRSAVLRGDGGYEDSLSAVGGKFGQVSQREVDRAIEEPEDRAIEEPSDDEGGRAIEEPESGSSEYETEEEEEIVSSDEEGDGEGAPAAGSGRDRSEWKTKAPLTWKPRHVSDWCAYLGPTLKVAGEILEENQVHGAILMDLKDADMKKAGIKDAKLRKELKARIKELKATTRSGLEALFSPMSPAMHSSLVAGASMSQANLLAGPAAMGKSMSTGVGKNAAAAASSASAPKSATVTSMASVGASSLSGGAAVADPLKAMRHRYRAIASYEGGTQGRLTFVRGDMMTLVQEINDDWMEVQMEDGRKGLAPRTYVQRAGLETEKAMTQGTALDRRVHVIKDYTGGDKKLNMEVGEVLVVLKEKGTEWVLAEKWDGTQGFALKSHLRDVPPTKLRVVTEWRGRNLAGQGSAMLLMVGEIVTMLRRDDANYVTVEKSDGSYGQVPLTHFELHDPDLVEGVTLRCKIAHSARGNKLELAVGDTMRLLKRFTKEWWEVQKDADGAVGFVPSSHVEQFVQELHLRAISDYSGSDKSMSLRFGDEMVLVRSVNEDWCEVEKKSTRERGLVPRSYVEEYDPSLGAERIMRVGTEYKDKMSRMTFVEGEYVTMFERTSTGFCDVRKRNGKEGQIPQSMLVEGTLRVTSIADYAGNEESAQLSFTSGEVFVVLSMKSKDWLLCKGENDRVGLIPTTYVEDLPHDPPGQGLASAAASTPNKPGSASAQTPMRFMNLPPAYVRNLTPPDEWTPAYVLSWLQEKEEFGRPYMVSFSENNVDGATLLCMDRYDLAGLGIMNPVHIDRLFAAIEALHPSKEEAEVHRISMKRVKKIADALAKPPSQVVDSPKPQPKNNHNHNNQRYQSPSAAEAPRRVLPTTPASRTPQHHQQQHQANYHAQHQQQQPYVYGGVPRQGTPDHHRPGSPKSAGKGFFWQKQKKPVQIKQPRSSSYDLRSPVPAQSPARPNHFYPNQQANLAAQLVKPTPQRGGAAGGRFSEMSAEDAEADEKAERMRKIQAREAAQREEMARAALQKTGRK